MNCDISSSSSLSCSRFLVLRRPFPLCTASFLITAFLPFLGRPFFSFFVTPSSSLRLFGGDSKPKPVGTKLDEEEDTRSNFRFVDRERDKLFAVAEGGRHCISGTIPSKSKGLGGSAPNGEETEGATSSMGG